MRKLLPALVAAGIALAPLAALAAGLSGSYYGIDDATGASISIEPAGDGFRGTFFDRHGNAQKFEAKRNGASAETQLNMDGRRVMLLVDPMPYGARVALVPLDAEGRLDPETGRLLDFVRGELDLPAPGPDFAAAPEHARERITANSFLASYEFWAPVGVRNGYLSLPERFRTLMRLFPAVQLDVIWKLCLAPDAGRALALALRGQGVSCAQVIDGIANAQISGNFDRFKAEARAQRATLRLNVRCADGYPESRQNCDRAARELSAQAVALDTAASVLARYR
ncbi:MAG TPA: hypothetical protein VMM59_00650 [Thermohalobaculum sp.]|nr:hypothetical protein [Thermohalobaculum sp.]